MFRRNGQLETALATLIQTQAQFVRDMAEIRKEFEEIKQILNVHGQLLRNLPEAIKEKIGFKQ